MNQDFVQVPCPNCGTIVWVSPGVGFAKCPSCQTVANLSTKQGAAFAETMPAQPSLMSAILKSDPPPPVPKTEPDVPALPRAAPAPPARPSAKLVLIGIAAAVALAAVALVVWLAARHAAQGTPPPFPGSSRAP
jgi:hypothetical protein